MTTVAVDKTTRKVEHLLKPVEAWLLPRLARAMPSWVVPDHLTALGVVAALAAGWCFANAGADPALLWWANLAIACNWFGDSLDGTLARVRKNERPRYGFYLDHLTDMLSVAALFVGLGLSPYMDMGVALCIVLAYYLLSINSHLEAKTLGIFQITYGLMGPTEARLILIAMSSAIALGALPAGSYTSWSLGSLDIVGLSAAAVMFVLVAYNAGKNLKSLAQIEPSAKRRLQLQ